MLILETRLPGERAGAHVYLLDTLASRDDNFRMDVKNSYLLLALGFLRSPGGEVQPSKNLAIDTLPFFLYRAATLHTGCGHRH